MIMSGHGIKAELLTNIRREFIAFPEIERVVLFGSRAKGNFKPNSDIDLALFGGTGPKNLERLKERLENLPCPYIFDLVDFESIENEELKSHIKRVGISIYEKA